jgi:MYXO-CTERM domain-containing protein
MRTKTWSFMALFLILLGLATYLMLAVRSTADDPWREVSIARHVATGCGIAAVVALAIGALLLHRRRRR